jgi:reactive intermediate/imine deaminase
MSRNRTIANPSAPAGLAFAGAVEANGFVFFSGCLGNPPGKMERVPEDFEQEARTVFANLLSGFAEAGLSAADAVKVTVYLTDMDKFTVVNDLFAEFFGIGKVARTTVEVSRLGLGGTIELEAIASRREIRGDPEIEPKDCVETR